MAILEFLDHESVGRVQIVDTSSVVVKINRRDMLSKLQVNHLVAIRASKRGQHLIGLVVKIMRKFDEEMEQGEDEDFRSNDIVKITLIGTFFDKIGLRTNQFKRTLESVPDIDADCFIMDEVTLTNFMGVISQSNAEARHPLFIGNYTINDRAKAWLDGNKLFQRHVVIAGSTGSGKSYTVASMIEQIAQLDSANAILFDIHGEYEPLAGKGIQHYKIAGPADHSGESSMFLPYWLLTYDEMLSFMLDRSDHNAPNQAMLFSRAVLQEKRRFLREQDQASLLDKLTIDSPVPYRISDLITSLDDLDTRIVEGANGKKQGEFYGKLSRFIQRLSAKMADKRLNFMFSQDPALLSYDYMNSLCQKLMAPASQNGGIKIINFSEVPSDVLPIMVSLIARVAFSIQQWVEKEKIHPIALFCEEAHLYIPAHVQQGGEASSLTSFERIAKEGRKYGVGLVVITQRPSEVNRTVLSQSSNFIAMRLTNAEDQNVVRRLLPDSLGGFAELLPILDIGEALVVGDASLLPSRVKIAEPSQRPNSATVKFWDKWSEPAVPDVIVSAVEALRRQSKGSGIDV